MEKFVEVKGKELQRHVHGIKLLEWVFIVHLSQARLTSRKPSLTLKHPDRRNQVGHTGSMFTLMIDEKYLNITGMINS